MSVHAWISFTLLSKLPLLIQIYCVHYQNAERQYIISVDKCSFYHLKGIQLPLLFEVCTGLGPVDALKVQVHLLSEGPTRGLGVCLTSLSMHFCS